MWVMLIMLIFSFVVLYLADVQQKKIDGTGLYPNDKEQ